LLFKHETRVNDVTQTTIEKSPFTTLGFKIYSIHRVFNPIKRTA